MDVIDLTMNKDYYVPLTKKEMIERLEYYKALTNSLDKKYEFKNKDYYELLDSLINLEISAFDISFPMHTTIPNILRDVLKYNVWHKTLNVVNKFNNREIILTKESEQHGYVKVYKSVISDINLKPPYAFTSPSITINSYETNYEEEKEKMLRLRNEYEKLKNELRGYRVEEICSHYMKDEIEDDSEHQKETDEEELDIEYSDNEKNNNVETKLQEYFRLNEELEKTRRELNTCRKSLCLYKDSIYKEVAHALLEEYHIPSVEGKDYVKRLPWITLTKKSWLIVK